MKIILISTIILVYLAAVSHKIKCEHENNELRSPLRSFAIGSFKKIRDILKLEELKKNIRNIARAYEKKLKEMQKEMESERTNEGEIVDEKFNSASNYDEENLIKKFFHFERI